MNTHYDPDLGHLHAHLDDNGDIEIHRDSSVSGHTMIPLGIAAVPLAMDILRLSGQAPAALVQRIATMIAARADAGDLLSLAEMRGVAATLRCGIGLPQVTATVPAGNVVSFRRVG
jgi:hypothetical protein